MGADAGVPLTMRPSEDGAAAAEARTRKAAARTNSFCMFITQGRLWLGRTGADLLILVQFQIKPDRHHGSESFCLWRIEKKSHEICCFMPFFQ